MASAMIERAELPVQRNSTLKGAIHHAPLHIQAIILCKGT